MNRTGPLLLLAAVLLPSPLRAMTDGEDAEPGVEAPADAATDDATARTAVAAMETVVRSDLDPAARPAAPPPAPGLAFISTPPGKGQDAFNRGLAAAAEADFPRAAQAFLDASAQAPDDPSVFFNAGLAEARIPGRELRAGCWLAAALAAQPAAADANAIRAEITALRGRTAVELVRITKAVADAAARGTSAYPAARAKRDWGDAMIAAGDSDGARRLAGAILEPAQRAALLLAVADAKRAGGDPDGARAAVDAARKAAEADPNVWERRPLLGDVAVGLARAGEPDAATSLFAEVDADLQTLKDDADASFRARLRLAQQRADAGFKDAARADLASARDFALAVKDEHSRNSGLQAVGEAQAALGDADGARATAAALADPYYQGLVLGALAEAQARAGDDAAARQTAARAPDISRGAALRRIADVQLEKGRVSDARATLADAAVIAANAPEMLDRTLQQTAVADGLARAGDVDAARDLLAAARKSQKRIPFNEDGGLLGPGSNQRQGKDAIETVEKNLRRRARPWAPWIDEVTGPLDAPPFPDVAASILDLEGRYDDTERYLSALLDATEAYRKERDAVEKLSQRPAAE